MLATFEKVAFSSSESFRCREFRRTQFAGPWHFHPEFELTLITESSGVRFVGNRVARYEPPDLVLLGPDLPHCWISDPGRKRARAVVLQFRREFLGQSLFEAPEFEAVRRLFGRARHGLEFPPPVTERLIEDLERLAREKSGARVVRMLSVLQDLAVSTRAKRLSSPGFKPKFDEHNVSRMERVHRYLLEHLEGEIRLENAARVAGLSAPAFCRYFRKNAGMTLMQFVNDLRVGNACRLLLQADHGVAEACFASGYNNLTHFNRQFLRVTGLTPRDYRRRYAALGD